MDTWFECFMKSEVVMQRRKFSREFRVEAVKLVRERGVSVARAAVTWASNENVVRKWVKEFGSDPEQAFPGHGHMKPDSWKSSGCGARSPS
jgi:transposase